MICGRQRCVGGHDKKAARLSRAGSAVGPIFSNKGDRHLAVPPAGNQKLPSVRMKAKPSEIFGHVGHMGMIGCQYLRCFVRHAIASGFVPGPYLPVNCRQHQRNFCNRNQSPRHFVIPGGIESVRPIDVAQRADGDCHRLRLLDSIVQARRCRNAASPRVPIQPVVDRRSHRWAASC